MILEILNEPMHKYV